MSLPELVLILIVALFVFGPDKLPELAKKLGRLYFKAGKIKSKFADIIYDQKQQLQLEDNILKAKAAEKKSSKPTETTLDK
jgi:sec-independent protein translocase protein TatB